MGFFKNLFSATTVPPLASYAALHTDLHSYLIPGIDDGAQNMEQSLELISGLYDLGYRKFITTPHVISDHFKNTPEIILQGLEKLREAVRKKGIDVVIEAAAEYYLDHELENKMESGSLLTFGDNYVLIEVSFINPSDSLDHVVFNLITNHYRPVLAHPERYPYWYSDMEQYERLRDRGVLLQLNINSLTGHYSVPTRKVAEKLLDRGWVDFLGTDCHHAGHINLLSKALKNKHLRMAMNEGNFLNRTL